jgi:Protein of unknown function (DUF4254)
MKKELRHEQLEEIFKSLDVWATGLATNTNVAPPPASKELETLLLQLLVHNHSLWLQEDFARRRDVADSAIVSTKHTIDTLNQQRNDTIEKIDVWLMENFFKEQSDKDLPLRTETPGSAFDRLSILSLKIYHMSAQTRRKDADEAHRNACARKLETLQRQQLNLRRALEDMTLALNRGEIRMVLYRQFKMYNDPSLNPQLYQAEKNK